MTDPNLTEQLETEKAELDAILAADDPTPDETPAQPVELDPELPAKPVKLSYIPNRHDRRRAAARARKSTSRNKK